MLKRKLEEFSLTDISHGLQQRVCWSRALFCGTVRPRKRSRNLACPCRAVLQLFTIMQVNHDFLALRLWPFRENFIISWGKQGRLMLVCS